MNKSAFIGKYRGRRIHAREVTAVDEAGEDRCWVKVARLGDEWILIPARPADVISKIREIRQISGELPSRFRSA